MQICSKGHLFDREESEVCPYCGESASDIQPESDRQSAEDISEDCGNKNEKATDRMETENVEKIPVTENKSDMPSTAHKNRCRFCGEPFEDSIYNISNYCYKCGSSLNTVYHCKNCGEQIEESVLNSANYCYICGSPLHSTRHSSVAGGRQVRKSSGLKWLWITLGVIFVILVIMLIRAYYIMIFGPPVLPYRIPFSPGGGPPASPHIGGGI